MIYKYFTCGSMSEKEGLTLGRNCYYDDGSFGAGLRNWQGILYKPKEITREEYDNYVRMSVDPSVKKGTVGIVNDEGYEKYLRYIKNKEEKHKQYLLDKNEPKISLVVKKIKKLLALEIIEESDVDVEISLNNMSEFGDEIKRRLTE